ncbi:hydroxyacylglutathione hydrolase [Sinimarinibacterium sp. NLF-5-8]|nr:hydroxyacylglutathione hydrolase [Sinimarinibacterium sp. NLF-5-8]QHS09849.1 hydroxyacylglutathione hydrolase [Sinimarinibacterium sp. NLF-5-8]
MRLHPIPAFADNYIWALIEDDRTVIVDPGDAAPVLTFLQECHLTLDAVLITHHHLDHIGGIADLIALHPAPVYGARADAARLPGVTDWLDDGDRLTLLGQHFEVFAVPGHTRGHIAYYCASAKVLLCGDTLFSAGCGRLFEGTPEQLHASLTRLAALPDDTQVLCTHEYTLGNLAFAAAVEPENRAIEDHLAQVRRWRAQGQPSLPSRIALEKRINPFLRTAKSEVRAAAEGRHGAPLPSEVTVLAALRAWKDEF